MVKISYHILYLLVMKTSILVGGQAVIEGVMMRVPGAYSTALRRKDGSIISKRYIPSSSFPSLNVPLGSAVTVSFVWSGFVRVNSTVIV